jgi:glutathione S-transferase
MTLSLHYHPLASFCWKVQIALYENNTPFTGEIVDLMNEEARARFFALSPMGMMPALRDERRARTVLETSIIIEYLDHHYAGAQRLLPEDEDLRLEARLWDRIYDNYVQVPMQKIVSNHRRPEGERDPRSVTEATATLQKAYDMIESRMKERAWAIGDSFGLADCAAAPALFYAGIPVPFAKTHPHVAAYFDRLAQRASFKRVIEEARPYFQFYPFKELIPERFL